MKRGHEDGTRSNGPKKHKSNKHDHHQTHQDRQVSEYTSALSQLPPPTTKSATVPPYNHFTVSPSLPALPTINDPSLASAPFKHKSSNTAYARTGDAALEITYERLELIGDAAIEYIATRLIDERFGLLPAGRQSQLRELLVKNETLAEFSRAYGFEKKVEVRDLEYMLQHAKDKGNKGFNKVLGDVFEAYVAAVIKADPEYGFGACEKWLTALWAPKLLRAVERDGSNFVGAAKNVTHGEDVDPLDIYNPTAKMDLQHRILANKGVKLEYEKYQDSIELKGDRIGQNRHFIALYLTGYGYERKLLGQGEGGNKVEAGNWAATRAMYGKERAVVEECEAKLKEMRAERAKEKAEKEEREGKAAGQGAAVRTSG